MPTSNPVNYDRLPRSDDFGAYWFGRVGMEGTSVIYPFSAITKRADAHEYFVCTPDGLALFDGPELKAFDSPLEALEELRRWVTLNNKNKR